MNKLHGCGLEIRVVHVKYILYSQSKSPKSNVLSERRRMQEAFSWFCRWRLLTSMRFNNPRQRGPLFPQMHALRDTSSIHGVKMLRSINVIFSTCLSYQLQRTFCNGLPMTNAVSENSNEFLQNVCFKGKALALESYGRLNWIWL